MSPAAGSIASIALLLLFWAPLPWSDAKPVQPQFGMVIQIPREFVRLVPLDSDGEPLLDADVPAAAARSLQSSAGASAFAFGPPSPSVFTSHSVKKKVRAKSSYQSSAMAAPRVTGCEAICALQKNKDGA